MQWNKSYQLFKIFSKINLSHQTSPMCVLCHQGGVIQDFLRFSKSYMFLGIRYIFRLSILKIRQISPLECASHARQSFNYQKIAGTLNMNIFLKICRILLYTYINEQLPRRKFEIKFPEGKTNIYLPFWLLHKLKNKFCFRCKL